MKTLHPAVHAGILARRGVPGDMQALQQHGFQPVDLVVVNLYPFARVAGRADAAASDLIEEIDIGGPALVRAAAKNFLDVLVCVDPADYPRLLEELDRPAGPHPAFRLQLARQEFAHTAEYDAVIKANRLTRRWAKTWRTPLHPVYRPDCGGFTASLGGVAKAEQVVGIDHSGGVPAITITIAMCFHSGSSPNSPVKA